MDIFLEGLSAVASAEGMVAITIGVLIGLIVGALPGLGQGTALLLTLPIALTYPMEVSLMVYASLLGATTFGGSITSIVLGIPGSAQNLTTVLDGYPMARRGEASHAIGLAAFSSLIGAVSGMIVVILILPFVRKLIYIYGSREYFVTIVFAAVIVAVVSTDFWKGLVSFGIGAMVSMVGADAVFGVTRYTGGMFYFWGKIPIAVFIIGLFALNGLVMLRSKGSSIVSDPALLKAAPLDAIRSFFVIIKNIPVIFRSSVIGLIVGILPGIGGEVAQFVSYGVQKGLAKNKDDYGKGEPRGVIASEASNSAKDSGALLPTLCLGIPGSPEMSIMLGILLVLGVDTGPSIMTEDGNILWAILIAAILGNVFAGIVCLFGSSIITKITIIPINFVFIATIILAYAATYSWATNTWDCLMLIPFCLLGMVLTRCDYPITNLILGYVLGPLAEKSFHTTLQSGLYDPLVFLQSTTSKVLLAATLVLLAYKIIGLRRKASKSDSGHDSNTPDENSDSAGRLERLILAAVLFVAAIIFAVVANDYTLMKAGLFPFIMAIIMAISLVFVLVSEIRGMMLFARSKNSIKIRGNEWSQYASTLVFMLAYSVVLILLGFYCTNLIMPIAFFLIFQKMNIKKSLGLGFVFSIAMYLIFNVAFKMILFPGAIPMIIPNYLGGGSLRPFF
jgi:putative tricarboxylic transport membrane protein